jgi:hypothetical protein
MRGEQTVGSEPRSKLARHLGPVRARSGTSGSGAGALPDTEPVCCVVAMMLCSFPPSPLTIHEPLSVLLRVDKAGLAHLLGGVSSLDGWRDEDRQYDGDEVKRREFLALTLLMLGAGAQTVDVERLASMLLTQRVDVGALDDLRSITRRYARRAEEASPHDLLYAVRTHLAVLTGLLAAGGLQTRARRELQSIAGETAVLVGGLSFRVENRRQAESCYALARYLARESGDQELSAYALGLESSLVSVPATSGVPYPATKRGKGGAIALLDEAEAAARSAPTPYLHAGVLVRRAEEHAARGEEAAADNDLALAARRVANGQAGEDRFFGAGLDVRRYEGLCAMLLGKPEAESILRGTLATTPASAVSERCGQLTDLAAALAQQGEVEGACSSLGEALELAVGDGQAMRVRRIRGVRERYLSAWASAPAVKGLDERLMAAGGA